MRIKTPKNPSFSFFPFLPLSPQSPSVPTQTLPLPAGLIILLMQVQAQQAERADPFQIVHNARSSRASRSRKSSISVVDRQRPRGKAKKLRKMTLNPESIRYEEIKEIEENHHDRMAVHSERAEDASLEDLPELPWGGWPCKMQSEKEQELQSAIAVGLGKESDLDWEFRMGGRGQSTMELQFEMREECCE